MEKSGNTPEKLKHSVADNIFFTAAKKGMLESIVWPEILKMVDEATNRLYREGKKVMILDAAVLLTAGWHEKCDEV